MSEPVSDCELDSVSEINYKSTLAYKEGFEAGSREISGECPYPMGGKDRRRYCFWMGVLDKRLERFDHIPETNDKKITNRICS